ncbi:MAG: DNA repair exonuclease [Candidatus Delongbacteria bacterium]|nr:DNA repair exonuclease [Candidatus Delongbacteria bacterium]
MTGSLRILLLADTHLGFDQPRHPRKDLPRRGEDFFRCHRAALAPAFAGEVHCVIHGGDLLFRSKVPASLVSLALAPYLELAHAGTPVFMVPGNHERSWIPHSLFEQHPRLRICNTPCGSTLELAGRQVFLCGIPYRRSIRRELPLLLEEAGWRDARAELKLLCLHQSVEGAQVGPVNYTFRHGEDVLAAAQIPPDCDALLSGHIHRQQVLTQDLHGGALPCPVIYPGSVERTSFAEVDEQKVALILEWRPGARRPLIHHLPLPARPMFARTLQLDDLKPARLPAALASLCADVPPESVLGLRLSGPITAELAPLLRRSVLRDLLPDGIRLSLSHAANRRDQTQTL